VTNENRKLKTVLSGFAAIAMLVAAGCSSPKVARPLMDSELAAASQRGRKAFQAGRYEAAAGFYRDALTRARMLNDPVGVGDSAYNLAASLVALGRNEPARAALAEARAECAAESVEAAEALLLEAQIAQREGKTDSVLKLTDQVLVMKLSKTDTARILPDARLRRASAYCESGNAAKARVERGMALLGVREKDCSPLLLARAAMIDAGILCIEQKSLDSAKKFDLAAAMFEQAGRPEDVASALTSAARGYEAAGKSLEAAERDYRAAKSYYAQGNYGAALRLIEHALPEARKAGSTDLEGRIRSVFAEIEGAVNAAKKATEQKEKQP
jgi:tetratricopeptide (TPR) repeat protein